MKIQYLGTGAAEGIPAIFCDCDVCKKSMEKGGKNIRTRSQAIVDDSLLIDFPADTYMHFLKNKLPLTSIKHCIITHSHQDHLYPEDILMRREGFSVNIDELEPLCFYSDESAYSMINETLAPFDIPKRYIDTKLVSPGVAFNAGEYKVLPMRAAHAPSTTPLVYIIEKDGKSIFYSHDTSEYPPESWDILKKYAKKLNLVSLDCTLALTPATYVGHMNLERCSGIRQKLFDIGVADENTIFVLNHFSHNGEGVMYDNFKKVSEKEGFLVSYDTMVIEF